MTSMPSVERAYAFMFNLTRVPIELPRTDIADGFEDGFMKRSRDFSRSQQDYSVGYTKGAIFEDIDPSMLARNIRWRKLLTLTPA